MHRMNANRVSHSNTSAALDDDSVRRIDSVVKKAQVRRADKHKKSGMKKTANKQSGVGPENKQNNIPTIRIASIQDIPNEFERIGTGFFRCGHHLWELQRNEEGYELTRKSTEDHVLGYDPEPLIRNEDVLDRYGNAIRKGSKVSFPMRGKIAQAMVIVLTPGSLGLDMGGGQIDVPPDMCELLEPEGMDEHAEEPMEDPMGESYSESDKEGAELSGTEFEPNIEPSSKEPGSECPECGAAECECQQRMAQKKIAQTDEPQTLTTEPSSPSPESGRTQVSVDPDQLQQMQAQSKIISDLIENKGRLFITSPTIPGMYMIEMFDPDRYKISSVQTTIQAVDSNADFAKLQEFEQELGDYSIAYDISALPTKQAMRVAREVYASILPNFRAWGEYWQSVGRRVRASTQPRKPPSEETKQKRKERRKQKQQEMAGLPKGTPVPPKTTPPKPKKADVDDGEAHLKSIVRVYEQMTDSLLYLTEQPELQQDDERMMQEMMTTIEDAQNELEEMESGEEQEMEDSLSLDSPSKSDKGNNLPTLSLQASRVEVAMIDL